MKTKSMVNKSLVYLAYIYLALPIIIFFLGWCKWYIGVPAAIVCCLSIYLAVNERRYTPKRHEALSGEQKFLIVLILAIILSWVGLSGIGGYAWQNTDHPYRNTIFHLLVREQWPVAIGDRGLTYYIGFWFPAAVIGKLFGAKYAFSALYFWGVIGVCIVYAIICKIRGKIEVWPLLILVFFSGMDFLGTNFLTAETVQVFGVEHIERWPSYFQYTSNTVQLYWVFNQAIPTWVAVMLIYAEEPPKNLLFISTLLMLTSTLPFIGLLPFVFYYMYQRCEWTSFDTVSTGWRQIWKNCGSFQNSVGAGLIGIVSFFYLMGNENFMKILNSIQELLKGEVYVDVWFVVKFLLVALVVVILLGIITLWLASKKKLAFVGKHILRPLAIVGLIVFVVNKYIANIRYLKYDFSYLITLFFFLLFEVGVLLYCMYKEKKDTPLFWIVTISLAVIPVIRVGESIDFCMRASIPALFVLMLWCIEMLAEKKKQFNTYLLIGCLLIGSITGLHEIKRSYSQTIGGYTLQSVDEELIMNGANFSGTTETFFWEHIAK